MSFEEECDDFFIRLENHFTEHNDRWQDLVASIYDFLIDREPEFINAYSTSCHVHEYLKRRRKDIPPKKVDTGLFEKIEQQSRILSLPSMRLYALLSVFDNKQTYPGSKRVPATWSAVTLNEKHYWVTMRSKWSPLSQPHSLTDIRWLETLVAFPKRLDGANIIVYELDQVRFHRYAEQIGIFDQDGSNTKTKSIKEVKVGVWPFARNLNIKASPEHWLVDPFTSEKQVVFRIVRKGRKPFEDSLISFENCLYRCAHQQISILMIPELNMSESFVKEIQSILKKRFDKDKPETHFPWLVVLGSYHEHGPKYKNLCKVLAGDGGEYLIRETNLDNQTADGHGKAWAVAKRHRYLVRRQDINANPVFANVVVECNKINTDVCVEPHQVGSELLVVQTPIGRIWVTICLDFLKTARMSAVPAYSGLADLVLVPAATPKTDDFHYNARLLSNTSGVRSVMVNACWLLESMDAWDKAHIAIAYAPRSIEEKNSIKWDWNGFKIVNSKGRPVNGVSGSANDTLMKCTRSCTECLWVVTFTV